MHAGEVYSPVTVQTQVDSLLKYYRDEGFSRAKVEAGQPGRGERRPGRALHDLRGREGAHPERGVRGRARLPGEEAPQAAQDAREGLPGRRGGQGGGGGRGPGRSSRPSTTTTATATCA